MEVPDGGVKSALDKERQTARDAIKAKKELEAKLVEMEKLYVKAEDLEALRQENEVLKAQLGEVSSQLSDSNKRQDFSTAYRKLGGKIDGDYDRHLYELTKGGLTDNVKLEDYVDGLKQKPEYAIYFGNHRNRGTADVSANKTVTDLSKERRKRAIINNPSLTPEQKITLATKEGIR